MRVERLHTQLPGKKYTKYEGRTSSYSTTRGMKDRCVGLPRSLMKNQKKWGQVEAPPGIDIPDYFQITHH